MSRPETKTVATSAACSPSATLVAPVGVNVRASRRVLEDLRDAVSVGPQQAGVVADETDLVRPRTPVLLQRLDVTHPSGDRVDPRGKTIDERVRRFG